ncbi:MAG: class I SAM-dependent methyltransferase [Bacteroidales bacterium]
MDNAGFEKFYDNQPDYTAFRSSPEKQTDYRTLADWKVRNLIRLVPQSLAFRNILEVGCAFGVLLDNIAGRLNISDRTGIDISGENINVARGLFPDCRFFKGTLEELCDKETGQLKGKKFDVIVLSDIIEHIPDDTGFLKAAAAVSDFILLNLPLEKSFRNRNRNYGEDDPSGHLRCYNRDLAEKLVTDAGLNIVRSHTSIAVYDKSFYRVYRKNRSVRVNAKPFFLRIFWTIFYSIEDKFKLVSKSLTERIYGTNFFALLESRHS